MPDAASDEGTVTGANLITQNMRGLHSGALLAPLLALATVAATATKFRVPDLPLGIGEFLLVTWLASSMICRSLSTGFVFRSGFALRWGGPFLLTLAVALSIGAVAAKVTGVTNYSTVHEAVAWIFISVLVGWFLLESTQAGEVLRFLRWLAGLGALNLALMLIAAIGLRVATGSQSMWYGGLRLSGFSENPNQLAILCAPLPFLCLHFARTTRGRERRAWTAGAYCCVATGLATLSDALLLAWGASAAGLALYKWSGWVFGRERTVRTVLAGAVALPALAAITLTLFGGAAIERLGEFAEERAGEGGQASTRIVLWQRGLQATIQSPFVGWGPGAHSGYAGPFEGSESHSAWIDLAAQAGLPAALALIALAVLSALRALRRDSLHLALAVASGFVLSLFHNTLRQPIFWLTIFAVMAACTSATRDAEEPRPPAI